MNLTKKENTIIVRLNKKFYDINSIEESVNEFSTVCKGCIKNETDDIAVELTPKEGGVADILGYEFSNFVLGLMKNKSIV